MRRGSEHLHRLGPRAMAEFLAEIAAAQGCGAELLARLDDWRARLTPELVRAVGADRFPPTIALVPHER
jgi:hypothetical protein